MMLAASPDDRSARTTWLCALLCAFLALFVLHVWVVDDAFITLRQVQQLLAGNGFVWNVGERVQAYTHPLWALLLVPIFAVTGEGFWTLAATSLVVSLVGIWCALRCLQRSGEPWRAVLFLLLLLPSKAFFDFTSSGLENCLTHALVVLTWGTLWAWHENDERHLPVERRRFLRTCLLVGLCYLNRADTLALVAPALVVATMRCWPLVRWHLVKPAFLGFLPVLVWTAWSVFYYGSGIPNTAVAKITGARLTTGECLQSGALYAFDSLQRDPYTLVLAAFATAVLLTRRRAPEIGAATGLLFYLGYVTVLGAAGTHMSGRFYSSVACLAAFALARSQPGVTATTCWRILAVAAAVVFLVPSSPPRALWQPASYPFLLTNFNMTIDTRSFVAVEGASILAYKRGVRMPDHTWFKAGLEFAAGHERFHVGGLGKEGGEDAVGFSAFAAGTDTFLIDHMGLTDALLARLPMPRSEVLMRPGHVKRALPAGYAETCRTGENRIEDPDLHAYWDALARIVRGPLWSWDRLRTIVAWNFGAYDENLDRYAERAGLRSVR